MTDLQLQIIIGVIVLIQTLGLFILKAILQKTIDYEFRKREQAAMVAALFAEWVDRPTEHKELNRLTWEATLWLPDNLAIEVNKRLKNAIDAKDVRDILIKVKELIHGKKSSLEIQDITYFSKKQ